MGGVTTAQPAGPPGNTVYVTNLHDRVKIPHLISALNEVFSEFGNVIDVNAKTHLKAKGQAFITFDNQESAAAAIEDLNGFVLFTKPMVCAFARMKSDVTVKREGDSQQLETHIRHRRAETERKKAAEIEKQKKRPAPDSAQGQQPAAKKGAKATGGTRTGIVPDEYLPPNKTLFLQNLPPSMDEDEVAEIFDKFEGFKEARVPPGNRGIGFVEYDAEAGAITAKENTAGLRLGEKQLKVTFQRQG